MGDGSASAHRGGNQSGFGQLRISGPGFAGCPVVQLDAVRALRRQRDGDRNQLLRLHTERAWGKRRLVEGPEGFRGLAMPTDSSV